MSASPSTAFPDPHGHPGAARHRQRTPAEHTPPRPPRLPDRARRSDASRSGVAPADDPYERHAHAQRQRRARRYAERRRDLLVDITAAIVLAIVAAAVVGLALIALISGAAVTTLAGGLTLRHLARRHRARRSVVARGGASRFPTRS